MHQSRSSLSVCTPVAGFIIAWVSRGSRPEVTISLVSRSAQKSAMREIIRATSVRSSGEDVLSDKIATADFSTPDSTDVDAFFAQRHS